MRYLFLFLPLFSFAQDTVSIQEQNQIIKALEQRIINIETN